MATAGISLISALMGADKQDVVNLNVPDSFFRPSEKDIWAFVKEHFGQYGVVPAEETIQKQFDDFALAQAVEPATYYVEKMRQRYYLDTMRKAMLQAKSRMDITKESYDIDKAFDGMMASLLELKFSTSKSTVVDFRKSYDMLYQEYIKVLTLGDKYGIRLGWETLDNMSGGIVADDVVAILGRPSAGKTFLVIRAAHHCWLQGKNVLVLSMEMKPLPILQRIATIHTNYNLTKFKKAEMSTKYKDKVFGMLKEVEGHKSSFHIADGNLSASIEDVRTLCHQLDPDVVFIDGAYLLRSKARGGRWEQVTQTVEGLKRDISSDMGIPSVASYQFNRNAAHKQKTEESSEEIGLEDIGYSDAVGQVSSLVLGMLQKEGIETSLRREVTILKGRGGERGKFSINWDFRTMDFDEVLDDTGGHGELGYL